MPGQSPPEAPARDVAAPAQPETVVPSTPAAESWQPPGAVTPASPSSVSAPIPPGGSPPPPPPPPTGSAPDVTDADVSIGEVVGAYAGTTGSAEPPKPMIDPVTGQTLAWTAQSAVVQEEAERQRRLAAAQEEER
ncbi:MAG: hypothetical protein C4319_06415, partial [Acidimicrobiia bacterium]